MNPACRCRLADGVVIRREAFGGLLYHHHRRQLTLIGSPELASLLAALAPPAVPSAPAADAAMPAEQPGPMLDATIGRLEAAGALAAGAAARLLPALARLAAMGLITTQPSPPAD